MLAQVLFRMLACVELAIQKIRPSNVFFAEKRFLLRYQGDAFSNNACLAPVCGESMEKKGRCRILTRGRSKFEEMDEIGDIAMVIW